MPAGDYETPFSRWKERLERRSQLEERTEAAEEAGLFVRFQSLGPIRLVRRVPTAAWALLGIIGGILVGNAFPGLAFIGEGVKATFGGIAKAAPMIIFFTLTPALVMMYRTASAGRFALYAVMGFVLTTLAAGLFALILSLVFFPQLSLSVGAAGLGRQLSDLAADIGRIAYESAMFRAIWGALLASTLLYFGGGLKGPAGRNPVRRMLRTINDVYDLIGVHGVAFLGRVIKAVMPVALFCIGIFLVTSVDSTLADVRAEAGGLADPPYSAAEAYFRATIIIAAITILWLIIVSVALARYTRFPLRRLVVEYLGIVYPFAWSTVSSAATIPINLESARKGLGVRSSVRDFIIPLGSTVNLDGTIMGAVVLTIICGSMVGYTPTLVDLLVALVPLLIISVGAPGVPGGLGLIAGPIIAQLLPLPPGTEVVFGGLFYAMSFGLTDQFRTGVNTVDNGMLALLLDKWWPERFEPGAAPNPFLVPPKAHLVTAGHNIGVAVAERP